MAGRGPSGQGPTPDPHLTTTNHFMIDSRLPARTPTARPPLPLRTRGGGGRDTCVRGRGRSGFGSQLSQVPDLLIGGGPGRRTSDLLSAFERPYGLRAASSHRQHRRQQASPFCKALADVLLSARGVSCALRVRGFPSSRSLGALARCHRATVGGSLAWLFRQAFGTFVPRTPFVGVLLSQGRL
jgi:hypothetical protein